MDLAARYARRGLLVLTAVLAVATVAGFLDRVSWVFETATLFRLQYAVVLVVIGVLALVLRRPWLAVAGLVLAAINVAVIAPWQNASFATAARAVTPCASCRSTSTRTTTATTSCDR